MPTVDFPGMRSINIDSARKRQAEIFAEAGDAAVLDSRLGLELKCGDDRAGIDLRDVPGDFEFGAFLLDGARAFLQLALVHLLAALGGMQQVERRQFEIRLPVRNLWLGSALFRRGRRRRIVELDHVRPAFA